MRQNERVQRRHDARDAHTAIAEGDWERADATEAAVRETLRTRFGIRHGTLETECARHVCGGGRGIMRYAQLAITP